MNNVTKETLKLVSRDGGWKIVNQFDTVIGRTFRPAGADGWKVRIYGCEIARTFDSLAVVRERLVDYSIGYTNMA